jgi:hypothetical protein
MCQAHIRLETCQAQLEMHQAQVKTVKEKWYHHGSKSGSLLRLREVILWPGNVAAIQGALLADIMLETRQAQGWKRIRLKSKLLRRCNTTMAVNLVASWG